MPHQSLSSGYILSYRILSYISFMISIRAVYHDHWHPWDDIPSSHRDLGSARITLASKILASIATLSDDSKVVPSSCGMETSEAPGLQEFRCLLMQKAISKPRFVLGSMERINMLLKARCPTRRSVPLLPSLLIEPAIQMNLVSHIFQLDRVFQNLR